MAHKTAMFAALVFIFIVYAPTSTEPRGHHHQLTGEEMTQILDTFLMSYDKRVRPYAGFNPVTVIISLYAIRLYSFSDLNKDFKIDFYFRQEWSDPRLKYDSHPVLRAKPGAKIKVGHEVINRIWTPDTFFPSDKAGYRASVNVPHSFLVIRPNGTVFMSQRFTTHTDCEGSLSFFPMDRYKCSLEFESYGFGTEDIIYKWILEKIRVEVGLTLESFNLVALEDSESIVSLSTGNYSRLGVKFVIDRKMGGYIWRFYIPLAILWVLSIAPFYLPVATLLIRFILVLTSFVLSIILGTIISTTFIPESGSSTSIDLYVIATITSILMSLITIITQIRIVNRLKSPANGTNIPNDSDQRSVIKTSTSVSLNNRPNDTNIIARIETMDNCAAKIFSISFTLFQLLYWITIAISWNLIS